jgi:signal transduction histidine kinase
LRSAGEETERLVRLAEDLLVPVRAGGHRLSIAREPVDVKELVARVAAGFSAPAAIRTCTIRTDVLVDGPISLDPARFSQIVGNLLDNAIRHSPGGAAVTAGAWIDDGALVLEVTDEGEVPFGIPAARLRAARAEASRSRAAGGTGLGLAIVQALAEAHGGTALARNRPGGGGQVVVTLPS